MISLRIAEDSLLGKSLTKTLTLKTSTIPKKLLLAFSNTDANFPRSKLKVLSKIA